jgi:hypothetical protein
MPSNYTVRLYSINPAFATFGDPQLQDVYGVSRYLTAWAANFGTSATFDEQLVSMTDPNGSNQVSNVNAIQFRCGSVGEGDRDVVFAGLCPATAQDAQHAGLSSEAIPLSVVALPGGRTRVAGAGRYSVQAGQLVFQL